MNSALASQNCGTVAVTDIPLAGDMYGGRAAEVMVYRKSAPAAFHVTRTGAKERVIKIGVGSAQPVLGDWDGDGATTQGIVRGPNSWYLTNSPTARTADRLVSFGAANDTAVAGDWNGDGVTTPGIARGLVFMYRDDLRGGAATGSVRVPGPV